VALEDLSNKGAVLPKLLGGFREAVVGLGKTFEEGRLAQERLGNHIAGLISEQLGILRAISARRSSASAITSTQIRTIIGKGVLRLAMAAVRGKHFIGFFCGQPNLPLYIG
jgi:hypothetical protein